LQEAAPAIPVEGSREQLILGLPACYESSASLCSRDAGTWDNNSVSILGHMLIENSSSVAADEPAGFELPDYGHALNVLRLSMSSHSTGIARSTSAGVTPKLNSRNSI